MYRLIRGNTVLGKAGLTNIGRGSVFIWGLIVYKRYRRKGFGTLLISELSKAVPQLLCLWVKKDNKPAINLYKKHNFVVLDIKDNFKLMVEKTKG